jgi:hypothetical protein
MSFAETGEGGGVAHPNVNVKQPFTVFNDNEDKLAVACVFQKFTDLLKFAALKLAFLRL